MEAALSQLAFAPPSLPFVSNLSGRTVGPGEALDAGLLAAADARAGGFPRLCRDLGGAGGGCGRGNRPACGARPDDRACLAEGSGRRARGDVESQAAGDRRGAAGSRVRRRFRGGGRGRLRGRLAAASRRALRWRVALPYRAAGLPLPARALLGGGAQAAGGRGPGTRCWVRATIRRAARSASTPSCSPSDPGMARRPSRVQPTGGARCALRRHGDSGLHRRKPRPGGRRGLPDAERARLSGEGRRRRKRGRRPSATGAAGRCRRRQLAPCPDFEQGRGRRRMDAARGGPAPGKPLPRLRRRLRHRSMSRG